MKNNDNSLYTKKQLLIWLNELIHLKVKSIDELSNGAAFCQLLSIISPGDIRMQKVNYNAKLQHENLSNLKILSTSMLSLGIDKKFNVERISQRKTQDILELLQWFRKYFLTNNFKISNNNDSNKPTNVAQKATNQPRLSHFINSKNRKSSNIQKTEITIGPKRQPQDLITDSQMKNCFKVNKEIQNIIRRNSQRAENKIQLIKALLFKNNSTQKDKKKQRLSDGVDQSDSMRGKQLADHLPLQEIKLEHNIDYIKNSTLGCESARNKTIGLGKKINQSESLVRRTQSFQKRGSHAK